MSDAELRERIKSGTKRIERLELDGRVLWIKRPEELTFRMRIQKGDAVKAFAEEVEAHRALAEKGLPVAPIVSFGPDHIVTEDSGPTIKSRLQSEPPETKRHMITAAATALADLHTAGEAHGRPNLKDICWADGTITFLDFERTGRDRDMRRAQEMDVLMFLFNICAETGGSDDVMTAARDAYANAQPDIWASAVRRLHRLRPLRYILWPVTRMLKAKKEFKAVDPFFDFVLG